MNIITIITLLFSITNHTILQDNLNPQCCLIKPIKICCRNNGTGPVPCYSKESDGQCADIPSSVCKSGLPRKCTEKKICCLPIPVKDIQNCNKTKKHNTYMCYKS
jgi:hypothetical protein